MSYATKASATLFNFSKAYPSSYQASVLFGSCSTHSLVISSSSAQFFFVFGIAIFKKYGFFQSESEIFSFLAKELGLLKLEDSPETLYSRHPLAYLVEAADDICYTIIDFEDGINLGLIDEEFALEYLIKLVKDNINTIKYNSLKKSSDRLAYLRSLAINTLVTEASSVFINNEEAILNGKFTTSLLDKSNYKAQVDDIIKISIQKIYKSNNVIDKEIAGYKILNTLLEVFTNSVENYKTGVTTQFDQLILNDLILGNPDDFSTYQYLIETCNYISRLTDSNAMLNFQKINGNLS